MKKLFYLLFIFSALSSFMITLQSCNDTETYAEMKDKEKKYIKAFLDDNVFGGKIEVITEKQFYAQDSITDTARNQYVLFEDDGIYMQIIKKGEGKTMVEMALETEDSTISKVILNRFLEYDIENADTTNLNYYTPYVDKMLCKYSHKSKSYSASFTEGLMLVNQVTAVPKGWLKPLNFIRLSKDPGKIAKVRVIVPHSSGTLNASGYVLPYFYEISFQLGK